MLLDFLDVIVGFLFGGAVGLLAGILLDDYLHRVPYAPDEEEWQRQMTHGQTPRVCGTIDTERAREGSMEADGWTADSGG